MQRISDGAAPVASLTLRAARRNSCCFGGGERLTSLAADQRDPSKHQIINN